MSEKIGMSVYRPVKTAKVAVLIVHGMSEHRKRYDEVARYLCEHGYGVVSYDLPGHGESLIDNEHGYFGSENGYQTLIKCEEELVAQTKKEFPKSKIVILSHSMGTMITRCFIQKHDDQISGVILSGAPYYQKAAPVGLKMIKALTSIHGKKARTNLIRKTVMGSMNKGIKNPKTEYDWLSVNQDNVQDYINDPECGVDFTNQGHVDLVKLMIQMNNAQEYKATNKDLPILFVTGEKDACSGGYAGVQSSIDILKKAGYTDISKIVYAGKRHEIFHEDNHLDVFQDIINWIDEKGVNKA